MLHEDLQLGMTPHQVQHPWPALAHPAQSLDSMGAPGLHPGQRLSTKPVPPDRRGLKLQWVLAMYLSCRLVLLLFHGTPAAALGAW